MLIKEGLSTGEEILVYLFLVPVTLLNIYMLHNFYNIIRVLRATRFFTEKPQEGGLVREGEEPTVTIQICVYNEAAVVRKTIDAACQVDWPKDKLFVQVLDDSTDQTSAIIEEAAEEWRAVGINCHRLTRDDRIGYKAGNLGAHTKDVQGEFVALFDADHRCERNYLRRAIPQFFNEDGSSKDEIGLVQTPWAYYNTHQNLLTEYDSLTLDYSHAIEQVARSGALGCFGFNGTGGIWRNSTIKAAGGWKWDTVTEDLDISYLAHLKGYRFIYLRDLPQQLECPANIRAHRQQKHRWTKGYMQVARKSLWRILTSPKASLGVKIEAFFHMTMAVSFINLMFIFILGPIVVNFGGFTTALSCYAGWPIISHCIGIILTVFTKVPSSNKHYATPWSRVLRLVIVPIQLVLAMGMVVFETCAVIDGLFNDDATFHRTPKEGTKHLTLYDVDDDEEAEFEDVSDLEAGTNAHKKKKKLMIPTFAAETLEGLAGLFLAAYLIVWSKVLIQASVDKGESVPEMILALMGICPALGLLYMHTSFVFATFWARYRAWNKKQGDKKGAVNVEKQSPADTPTGSDDGSAEDSGSDPTTGTSDGANSQP